MTTLAHIAADMKDRDAFEAPGSETAEWGVFCQDALRIHSVAPYDEDHNDIEVSQDFAAYWIAIANNDHAAAARHGDIDWLCAS